jgi:hypothetical protein
VHDILVTLAFLAFFRYDISLNVIAAILTVTGYSTNDTIVIFDRVRENMRSHRRESLNHIINLSINQTLGRTVITAGTALLSAVALFLFGGEVLHGFAFTMIVGIVTGTYSSVSWPRHRDVLAAEPSAGDRGGGGADDGGGQPADAPVQAAEGSRVVGDLRHRGAARDPAGPDRVPADLVDGAPADREQLLGFRDPGGVFTVMIQLGSISR